MEPINTARVEDAAALATRLDVILEAEADIEKGSDVVDITTDALFRTDPWAISIGRITVSGCLPVRTLHTAFPTVGCVRGSTAVPTAYCPHCSLCFGTETTKSILGQVGPNTDILVRVCPANPLVRCCDALVMGRAHRGVELATQHEKNTEWFATRNAAAAASAEEARREAVAARVAELEEKRLEGAETQRAQEEWAATHAVELAATRAREMAKAEQLAAAARERKRRMKSEPNQRCRAKKARMRVDAPSSQ